MTQATWACRRFSPVGALVLAAGHLAKERAGAKGQQRPSSRSPDRGNASHCRSEGFLLFLARKLDVTVRHCKPAALASRR